MNYPSIYQQLIERAKTRTIDGYVERHHIVPRCMCGSDEVSNLIDLLPEEHFLAHVLLLKMYPTEPKLACAVRMMCRGIPGKRKSRKLYGWLRRRCNEVQRTLSAGSLNSQHGRGWINNGESEIRRHDLSQPIPDGWYRGKAIRQPCPVCGRQPKWAGKRFCSKSCSVTGREDVRGRYVVITDGREERRHDRALPLPEGWQRGRFKMKDKGRWCWITDGTIDKYVTVSERLPEGWTRGRTNMS